MKDFQYFKQARVLDGGEPVTTRPADLLEPEMARLQAELDRIAGDKGIELSGVDDVLTYALFPQVGLHFLENRGNSSAFEPAPGETLPSIEAQAASTADGQPEHYQVEVNGKSYDVVVSPAGAVMDVTAATSVPARAAAVSPTAGEAVEAPLAGTIFRVLVKQGDHVESGQILLIMEAMKMETEVRSPKSGTVTNVSVKEGDTVELGHTLAQVA